MFCRVARSLSVLSPHLHGHRQITSSHRFVRLLSQSAALNTTQVADTDLIFDMGGSSKGNIEPTKSTESKRPKESKLKSQKTNIKTQQTSSKRKDKLPKEKKDRSFDQLKQHDPALDLTYARLPFDHPAFHQLMLMLKSRKYREEKDLLLIEGRRLTLEGIEVGMKIKYLLFSTVTQIESIRNEIGSAITKQTEIIRVPHSDSSHWSTLTTCPGLITVFEKPKDMNTVWNKTAGLDEESKDGDESDPEEAKINSMSITVICDQVRESNNLGGIIRSCAAIPCAKVILLKGCADPWDVKALRGGCGAQFRIPIVTSVEWEQITDHLPHVSDVSVFIADNQMEQDQRKIVRDEFEEKRKQNNIEYFKPKVYSDIPYSNCKHIVLVIGGETEGVSSHALDFMNFASQQIENAANENQAENSIEITKPDNAIVEIPLGNGVESLNASVATAILLFEMRKQLKQ